MCGVLRALQLIADADKRRIAWQALLHGLPKERWTEMMQALDDWSDDLDDDSDPPAYATQFELARVFAKHLSVEDPV